MSKYKDYRKYYNSSDPNLECGFYKDDTQTVFVFGNGKFRMYSDDHYFIYGSGRNYSKEEFKLEWVKYSTKLGKLW